MRFLIFVVLMMIGGDALASQGVVLGDGDLNLSRGRLTLAVAGKTVWRFKLKEADVEAEGSITSHTLSSSGLAIHVRYKTKGGDTKEAVFLRRGSRRFSKPIWHEKTDLKGDVGERHGSAVRFTDLTGDGFPEIVVGTVKETVRLCGQNPLPLLFRKVYDLKANRFKSVLARRPGLVGETEILGTLAPKGPKSPIVRHIAPKAASRLAGDRSDPLLLAPPGGVADNNPHTAWMPLPENGAGEFVTLDILTDAYGIQRVGVQPFFDPTKPKEYDTPKSLLLTSSTGVNRLVFPAPAEDGYDKMVWFELPQTIRSKCLSLVIESGQSQSNTKKMAIAEIVVITEADGPGGLDRVASDFLADTKRPHATRILDRAGAKAVPVLRGIFDRLDWQGKKSAVTIVAHRAPKIGADILVRALMEEDPSYEKVARMGLKAAGEGATDQLAPYLSSEVTREFEVAVDALASIQDSSALKLLFSAAGKGNRGRRAHLRARTSLAVHNSLPSSPSMAEELWREIEIARENGDRERTLDLLRSAVGIETLEAKVIAMSSSLYGESDRFSDRYRLLGIMGRLGCRAPFPIIVRATRASDEFIRAAAQKALGACEEVEPSRRDAALFALDDPEPVVRMAVLDAMLSNGFSKFAPSKIGMLSKEDEWTDVRVKSVANCRHLSPKQAAAILLGTQIDPSLEVRVQTIKSAIPIPGKPIDNLVEARLKDPNERPLAKQMAAIAAGLRCQESAVPFLFESLTKGTEPLASQRSIDVAEAAANAMGEIGTDEALSLLEEAQKRSDPATGKAIDAALNDVNRRCVPNRRGSLSGQSK